MSRRYYGGYEEEDELDVHITRQRSRSPAPPFYGEVRHTRPPIHESYSYGGREYERGGGYLIPAGGRQRAYSTGRRTPSPVAPPPQPVIINNKIYNERDEDDDYYHHHHHGQLAPFEPRRRRASSFNAPPDHSREEWELEQARKQLANYKLEEDKAAERKRVQKELELERLRKEKEEEEEEEKLKDERKKAIEKYKADEIQRIAKEKKERENNEREYKERLAADMRKSGVDEKQIALVLKGEAAKPPPPKEANRPIFTRMSRRHLSIETLNKFRVEYEFDHDPDYILIKRSVPEYEQDFWWTHTREVRDRRNSRTLLTIESTEKKHKHHNHDEVEFEFIRKKKHERKPSPSPLLTFLAGGKR